MSDRPYTDADLRAEAARQHATLTDDPDFMGVGEQMEDAWVPSVETTEDGSARTWKDLLVTPDETGDDEDYTAFDEARRKILAPIEGAADVSEWAVNLGADGLEPAGHTIQLGAKGPAVEDTDQPFVRLHFAFHPDATAAERDRFVMELSKVVLRNL
ncbi:hypothetical protein GPA10_05055 [Streptomyces sp. p1417]|uniref:Uncharacterized protein n=1 Tax=Streptomyces typhae TaxID=2681492 RepID=A0A6L6WSK7_9ACTN|nr:hypothetical protein [Streptomyces typhae]MVO84154.1 hypothetical protein [Streptomyces typhae]